MSKVTDLFIHTVSKEMITAKEIELVENGGIKGDRYFGDEKMQVVIAGESAAKPFYDHVSLNKITGLCFSRFKANVVLDQLNAKNYPVGSILNFDETFLEVTSHKPCFPDDCDLSRSGEICRLKESVVFAIVIKSGKISIDSELH